MGVKICITILLLLASFTSAASIGYTCNQRINVTYGQTDQVICTHYFTGIFARLNEEDTPGTVWYSFDEDDVVHLIEWEEQKNNEALNIYIRDFNWSKKGWHWLKTTTCDPPGGGAIGCVSAHINFNMVCDDTDDDLYCDEADNCPGLYNPDQGENDCQAIPEFSYIGYLLAGLGSVLIVLYKRDYL